MKMLSEKKSVCITQEILYEKGESWTLDIKARQKDGWHPVKRPNYYDSKMEVVRKNSPISINGIPQGTVIVYNKWIPCEEDTKQN